MFKDDDDFVILKKTWSHGYKKSTLTLSLHKGLPTFSAILSNCVYCHNIYFK